MIVAVLSMPVAAERPVITEFQVKAAMLFNFSRFVEWPAGASGTDSAAIRICIFGENPFGSALSALSGRETGVGKIEIVEISEPMKLQTCQLVFFGVNDAFNRNEILKDLASFPVLTVSDTEGFEIDGGMIRFLTRDRRLRFMIHQSAINKAGLTISSKLLRLAIPPEDL